MKFTYLELNSWRNFQEIGLALHPRLTVLTGANGSGKTTILNLLGQHFEPIPKFTAVPQYLSGEFGHRSDIRIRGNILMGSQVPENMAGLIRYSADGEPCRFFVPGPTGPTFELFFMNRREINGCHISFRRPISRYIASTTKRGLRESAPPPQELLNELKTAQSDATENQLFEILKNQLLLCAVHDMPPPIAPEPPEWFMDFERLLRGALPREIGFRNFLVRQSEVVLITGAGEFAFDGSSGGIASVIYVCWKIFLCSLVFPKEFVVTVDEPENHLHPSMQQSLVTALVQHFPQAQFIVGTHSPFVVTCWPESLVYALRFVNGWVRSELLESSALKTSTPDDILKEVLGLPFTMPLWAASRLEPIVGKFSGQVMNGELYKLLASELKEAGLSELMPETLEVLTNPPESE